MILKQVQDMILGDKKVSHSRAGARDAARSGNVPYRNIGTNKDAGPVP